MYSQLLSTLHLTNSFKQKKHVSAITSAEALSFLSSSLAWHLANWKFFHKELLNEKSACKGATQTAVRVASS